jgi:nucleotide-binding universal stress UspA family protein
VFERIIVPLDGSPSAEAALPAAEELARRLGSSLVLLHVLEPKPPRLIHGERHLAGAAEAEAYLAPIQARLAASGIAASVHVHAGATTGLQAVAASVAAHEAEFGNDLAVMVAHGRHGPSDLLSGSLPLKVAAAGGAAVLLVPGPWPGPGAVPGAVPGAGEAFAPRRILLPLDGRAEHEAALPAAAALASAFGLEVALVAAVPRRGGEAGGAGSALARLAPALSGASLEFAAQGSRDYLAGVAEKLSKGGAKAEWRVERGRPVKAILAAARPDDLLVLSTHRRLGLDASLDGCVAFGLARAFGGAILVVPVPRAADDRRR